MNAPASLPARRDRYIPHVQAFLYGCEGEELSLRCSLLLIRDNAQGGQRGCSDEASGVLKIVHALASRYAFESMPLDSLRHLRRGLLRLASCASDLEMFVHRRSSGGGE